MANEIIGLVNQTTGAGIANADARYALAASGVTNGDSHDHNGGDGAAIVEAAITLADNTTNNVSATKHGFFPKLPSVSDDKYYALKNGAVADATQIGVIRYEVGDGSNAITASAALDRWLQIPFACTITKAVLTTDASSSAVVDVWKDTDANFPPTVADTITASAKPTLSSASKAIDSTLTGWTKTIAADDWIKFHIDSVSTAKTLALELTYVRS